MPGSSRAHRFPSCRRSATACSPRSPMPRTRRRETLLRGLARTWRASRAAAQFRSWLYRIATDVCLKAIERRPEAVAAERIRPAGAEPHDEPGARLVEAGWIEPLPGRGLRRDRGRPRRPGGAITSVARASSSALGAALQHLPARQRAVLILRDVIGLSAGEVAETLESSPRRGLDSALQRAQQVGRRTPAGAEPAGDAAGAPVTNLCATLVERFYVNEAWERGDVDGASPRSSPTTPPSRCRPIPTWFHGREAVGAFLAA